jgi:hypothetical protein
VLVEATSPSQKASEEITKKRKKKKGQNEGFGKAIGKASPSRESIKMKIASRAQPHWKRWREYGWLILSYRA